MEHRDIVAHDGRLADDDGMRMVDHDAAPDPGGWVDIDAEGFRHAHLHEIGQVLPSVRPEPVAHAIGLNRLIALEEEDRLQEAMAGGVALVDGDHVGPRHLPELRIRRIGLVRDLAQDLLAHLARSELQRKAVGERPFHGRMVQEARMNESAEKRLGKDGGMALFHDPLPDRVHCRNTGSCLSHCSVLSSSPPKIPHSHSGRQGKGRIHFPKVPSFGLAPRGGPAPAVAVRRRQRPPGPGTRAGRDPGRAPRCGARARPRPRRGTRFPIRDARGRAVWRPCERDAPAR